MKTRIHVNQHAIKRNRLTGERRPVVTCKTHDANRYAHEAAILVGGVEVARVIYRPDKPLPCGAVVWLETEHEVRPVLTYPEEK